MRKIIGFLLIVCCLSAPGYSQGTDQYWFKTYSGSIGKYPITFLLQKKGPAYTAYYYYHSTHQPIAVSGSDTAIRDGQVRLTGIISDTSSESFSFRIDGKTCKGEWTSGKRGAMPLPFTVTEQANDPFKFIVVYTDGSLQLRPSLSKSPVATYEAFALWPTAGTASAIALQKKINEAYGAKTGIQEVGKLMLARKKEFLEDYKKSFKDDPDSEIMAMPHAYNMEESRNMQVIYLSPTLITLSEFYYSYMGGAHGFYSTSYIPVNLVTNKQILLKDVVTPQGQKQLRVLLEKYFRLQRGLSKTQPLTDGGLFENKLEPNDNFHVTATGITFNYSPYEVASYADGEIEVFVPFSEMKAYLQPAFKTIIK